MVYVFFLCFFSGSKKKKFLKKKQCNDVWEKSESKKESECKVK